MSMSSIILRGSPLNVSDCKAQGHTDEPSCYWISDEYEEDQMCSETCSRTKGDLCVQPEEVVPLGSTMVASMSHRLVSG